MCARPFSGMNSQKNLIYVYTQCLPRHCLYLTSMAFFILNHSILLKPASKVVPCEHIKAE